MSFELVFELRQFILQRRQYSRAQGAESSKNKEVVIGCHELAEASVTNILPRLLLPSSGVISCILVNGSTQSVIVAHSGGRYQDRMNLEICRLSTDQNSPSQPIYACPQGWRDAKPPLPGIRMAPTSTGPVRFDTSCYDSARLARVFQ